MNKEYLKVAADAMKRRCFLAAPAGEEVDLDGPAALGAAAARASLIGGWRLGGRRGDCRGDCIA